MKWWTAGWDALMANRRHRFSLMPDDALYVAMLAAWVAMLAIVTYLLLGWASAGVAFWTAS
jgi:hypothetical protein